MSDDAELLRRYAETRDEAAFAEIVRRHVDLVYAAALRQLGGAMHRAQDVTQSVFVDLARRASAVAGRTEIVGWLYTSTHYAAAKLKRGEQRRQTREAEAQLMHELTADTERAEWERLRPVLDEAMLALPERDRAALLLRFFEGRRLGEVGARLGVSEDAARMRVERALEKLRRVLERRGVGSSMAALGVALETGVIVAAPEAVAAGVTKAALAAVGVGSGAAVGGGFVAGSAWVISGAVAAVVAGVGTVFFVSEPTTRAAERAGAGVVRARAEVAQGSEVLPTVQLRIPAVAPGGVGAAADNEAALAAGERAMASDPEVRRLVEMARHGFVERHRVPFLVDMGLRPAEREDVVRAVLARAPFQLRVTEGGHQIVEQDLRSEEKTLAVLRGVLDEARFREFQEMRRIEGVRKLAKTLAVILHPSATPLEPRQAEALIETTVRHARQTLADGRVTLSGIRWSTVKQELAGVLRAEQLDALDTAREAVMHRQFGEGRRGIAVVPVEWAMHQEATELRQLKAELGLDYAWLYRELGLNAAVGEKFETRLVEHEGWRRDLRTTERALGPIAPENAVPRATFTIDGRPVTVRADRTIMALRAEGEARLEADLRALLGAGGYERWTAFQAAAERRGVVMRLVSDMALSGVPVSRAQTEKLERVLEQAGFTQKYNPAANWPEILTATERFLGARQQEELAVQAARAERDVALRELSTRLRRRRS